MTKQNGPAQANQFETIYTVTTRPIEPKPDGMGVGDGIAIGIGICFLLALIIGGCIAAANSDSKGDDHGKAHHRGSGVYCASR